MGELLGELDLRGCRFQRVSFSYFLLITVGLSDFRGLLLSIRFLPVMYFLMETFGVIPRFP